MRERIKTQKTLFLRMAAVCIACCFFAVCGMRPIYAEESAQTDVYARIDEYLQTCAQRANISAMSVCIVDRDKVLLSGNYGQCESGDTPFMLGSVSKSFTAVCVMQLVEQKRIDLNAAISAYLPDATDGNDITVRQLLNHTSGLGEHQTLADYHIVNKQGIHSYANVNYTLLGEILEAVSGQSYSAYISENLFEPLGLSHTAATLEKGMQNGLIGGYTSYWGIPVGTKHKYPASKYDWITVPAGYLSASSNDLGTYLQMYLNGGSGILSQQSIDAMFYGDTVYVDGDIPFWYGYGWATVKEPLAEPVLRHSGLVETGSTCVFILPERGIGVAIETNVNDYFVTNDMVDSLGWGVVLMLLGDSPNEIAGNAYVLRHLWINLIMLAVLLASVLPWGLLPRYVHGVRRGKSVYRVARLVAYHLLLPILILLLVPVFFATPLWVAKAFVPDVFLTVAVSSALLFLSGAVKCVILYRANRSSRS